MTSTYTPLQGSVAERAYEYLRRHAGEWIANAKMSEAFHCDGSSIIQSLRTALERKLVERRNEGRLVFWRMPKAPGGPGDEPDDDERPVQRTVSAPSRDPALTGGLLRVRSAFDLAPRLGPPAPDDDDDGDGECRNLDAPAPLPMASPRPTGSVVPGQGTQFALWSNGVLEIRRQDDLVLLTKDDTRALLRYLTNLSAAWDEVPA
jgi:hypothetical protein